MPEDKITSRSRSKSWLHRLKSSSPKLKRTAFTARPAYANADFGDYCIMGKANKFDYTNRPNSGAKLGQIIGTALQKEAEKVKKDADRHLQKARKQSIDSSGTHDAASTQHIIDLKAPNKDLGDDGVCALAEGLETSLRNGQGHASLALEDLNLSGNGITTRSLARLAPVIELAKYDLKTLNLADNAIKVESVTQAAEWEGFLVSFKDCKKLRRLDISGNLELGARAMEILARVHTTEPAIHPIPPGGETSTLSLISEHGSDDYGATTHRRGGISGYGELNAVPAMSNARMIRRRCGLRSIPYITLGNIGLEDLGALWLSYVLEDHHYPTQLIDELNSTHPDSTIKTYQQEANFHGIDWRENATLGKEGHNLLEKVEAVRRQTVLDDRATVTSSTLDDADSALGDGDGVRRKSTEHGQMRLPEGKRRVSIRSIRTADGGEHENTELESARKKIKRYIISHDGPSSVELWRSALQFFRTSRLLLYICPVKRVYYTGQPMFQVVDSRMPSPKDGQDENKDARLRIETARAMSRSSTTQSTYASRLVASPNGNRNTELAITEVTNTPTTPMIFQRPTHRKGGFSSDEEYFDSVNEKLNALVVRDNNPLRFVKYQERRVVKSISEGREFRDTKVPCNLPENVMVRILGFLLSDRECAVMSSEQKAAALGRGQMRDTLMSERDWLKKDESTQVLMLLDSIGCLAYRR